MRVAAFTSHKMPPRIEIRERPTPTPGPGEAVVRVDAAAFNPRGLWKLRDGDRLRDEDLPFVPGGDLAGVVERTSEEPDPSVPPDTHVRR
jgi:NADPH:quinone reductase-like Zn-dependent oxidoreductase